MFDAVKVLKQKDQELELQKKFKAGDVFWAHETNGWHLTIILEDLH
ncbi:MAG: hypothetical protein IPL23_16230 [Saprospiraceae bacterium]|nr:hypothetical protein [Saprospiraceae bacterium]